MTTQALEQAIRDLIRELYCKEYTGKLKVNTITYKFPEEEPIILGYTLELGLNKEERPLFISYEGSEDNFLEKVKKELLKRDLSRVDYFTAIQLYRYDDECKK